MKLYLYTILFSTIYNSSPILGVKKVFLPEIKHPEEKTNTFIRSETYIPLLPLIYMHRRYELQPTPPQSPIGTVRNTRPCAIHQYELKTRSSLPGQKRF